MNEVCSKDSINWFKYGNFITINNTYIYEEWNMIREIQIKLISVKKEVF